MFLEGIYLLNRFGCQNSSPETHPITFRDSTLTLYHPNNPCAAIRLTMASLPLPAHHLIFFAFLVHSHDVVDAVLCLFLASTFHAVDPERMSKWLGCFRSETAQSVQDCYWDI